MFYSGTFTYLLVPILSISLLIVHCSMHQIDDSFFPHSLHHVVLLLIVLAYSYANYYGNFRSYEYISSYQYSSLLR
jgi:hypothetical protein